MASSSLRDHFMTTLQNVVDLLNQKNVQDIASQCERIPSTRRDDLKGGMELFELLQNLRVLHETNVNILIGWLEKLHLEEACKLLKEYREKHLKDKTEATEYCTNHSSEIAKYFCITCNSKICMSCYNRSHKKMFGCDVIEHASIPREIDARRDKLLKQLHSLQKKSKNLNDLWNQKKETIAEDYEKAKNQILEDTASMREGVEICSSQLLETLKEKHRTKSDQLNYEEKTIADILITADKIMDFNKHCGAQSLSNLQMIYRFKQKVEAIQATLEQLQGKLKNKFFTISYNTLSTHPMFDELHSSSLIGGVVIDKIQLVHVFDEREKIGGVKLVCIDPNDPKKEYWDYVVPCDDHNGRVVMSCIGLLSDVGRRGDQSSFFASLLQTLKSGLYHVVFAVGKRVCIVTTEMEGAELHTTLDLDDIQKDSFITSIYAYYENYDLSQRFLISVSNSSVLREYRISGEPLRILDVGDILHPIKSIAYIKEYIAVVCGSEDVILFKGGEVANQSGLLKCPQRPPGLFPYRVIWTGAYWLVLFVGDEMKKQWKLITYEKTGKLYSVVHTGTLDSEENVPVSVTRWQYTGYVSFANSFVGGYEH